ncbi:hypothetical protein [Methanobacterium ferruginis]|uniref:hypothetical protein n=1 Tax=Methanobacterium ferruginis TaxID=710191 RepID=UPI002572BD1F|nr:hypothetical protein [Methanobacterium ferruginis]BDZ68601.1 hypothetical protein GCM10025860_20490 [Methanobacterium ferruginis]
MTKTPIKIPNLYPEEEIIIVGNSVKIKGYKPADKPYEIQIRHLRTQALEVQKKVNEIIRKEDNTIKPDAELTDDEMKRLKKLHEEILNIGDFIIYGDPERENQDQMEGPAWKLAQRGIKRYYYPDKTSSELDEIEDIELAEGHVKQIANIMIRLSSPPSGLERSIQARKKEQEKNGAGKGKQSKGKNTSQHKKK